MADNQTLLTDQEIQDIADGFDIYGAKPEFARAIASAVLSKLRAAGEPSDDDILRTFNEACEYADRCGQGFSYGRIQALRAVLARYGRPAGDAQPVAWVAADTLNSPHPRCVSSLAYMSQIDQDRGREYVPLAIIDRYAAPQASAEKSAIDRPIPDSVEHYGLIDERVGAPAAEPEWIDDPHDIEQDLWAVAESVVVEWQKAGKMPPMTWDFREFLIAGMRAYALADHQQRGGDVDERAAFEAGWKINAVEASDESPQGYLDGCMRADWEAYRRNRAALAAQPAASAEPVNRQAIADCFAFLEGVVNEHNYRLIVDTACALAAHNTGGGGADAAVAAIRFALEADDGMAWLRCWNEGDFDACRNEWPETPEECFIGADPLHPSTRAILAAQPATSPLPRSRTGG